MAGILDSLGGMGGILGGGMGGDIDPKTLAMLQMAMAGLQASGPQPHPTNLGQIVGQAGQAGLGAYQQSREQQLKRQMLMAQMAEQKRLHDAQIAHYAGQTEKDKAAAAEQARKTEFWKTEAPRYTTPEGAPDISRLVGAAAGVGAINPEAYLAHLGQREDRKAQLESKERELVFRLADKSLDREQRERLTNELIQVRRDVAGMMIAARPEPSVTPVTIQDPKDPNGTIIIDARTREVLGKGPKLTDAGKLEQKRAFNMQGIGATIQEAEDILSGIKRDPTGVTQGAALPTGSGVGTGVDYVASLVGATPKGAIEAQRLKAVSGALVSKMPRMEGPQSDKDVALYKEMAAEVGNTMIPVARRKAALQTVKDLWAKYEKLNPDAFQGTSPIDYLLNKYR